MNGLVLLLDWIEYLFGRGRRKAWCEISGGHRDVILGAWAGHEHAFAIKLHCDRCDRETGWIRVPEHTPTVSNGGSNIDALRCADPDRCPYPVCVAVGHCESSSVSALPNGER